MMHVMSGTFNYNSKVKRRSKLNGKRQGVGGAEISYVTQEPWIYTTSRSSGQQLNFGSESRGRGLLLDTVMKLRFRYGFGLIEAGCRMHAFGLRETI
jgi:hypothetical protein